MSHNILIMADHIITVQKRIEGMDKYKEVFKVLIRGVFVDAWDDIQVLCRGCQCNWIRLRPTGFDKEKELFGIVSDQAPYLRQYKKIARTGLMAKRYGDWRSYMVLGSRWVSSHMIESPYGKWYRTINWCWCWLQRPDWMVGRHILPLSWWSSGGWKFQVLL